MKKMLIIVDFLEKRALTKFEREENSHEQIFGFFVTTNASFSMILYIVV
jgi:hypothetical protein